MDEHILQSLENFDELWRRVSIPLLPAASPATPVLMRSADPLTELIALGHGAARRYEQLAARSVGGTAQLLRRHRDQCRSLVRRLEGEFFLLHGRPTKVKPLPSGKQERPEALRSAYLTELDIAGHCEAAADEDEALSPFYRQMAAEARHRAEEDRRLVLQCF